MAPETHLLPIPTRIRQLLPVKVRIMRPFLLQRPGANSPHPQQVPVLPNRSTAANHTNQQAKMNPSPHPKSFVRHLATAPLTSTSCL